MFDGAMLSKERIINADTRFANHGPAFFLKTSIGALVGSKERISFHIGTKSILDALLSRMQKHDKREKTVLRDYKHHYGLI